MEPKTLAEWMAETRREYAPPEGEAGAKVTRCERCGDSFTQWERSYKTLCIDCAAARHEESVDSLRNKRGPMYEKWLLARYRSTVAEMKRLGLTPEA